AYDAPRHTRNPDLAILLESAHLGDGLCPNPLPRRLVDPSQRRNRERDMLADHLPILLRRFRYEHDPDIPLGDIVQSGGLVLRTDISRGSAAEHAGPLRVGW